jgi:uncharacterized protein DUF3455
MYTERLSQVLFTLAFGAAAAACAADHTHSPVPPVAAGTPAKLTPPAVPDNLKTPEGEAVATRAAAKGVQIYECQASANSPGAYAWKLTGPDAELMDEAGQRVGRHYAGPTWEAADGSKVTGELAQKADAPDGQGVPWLLLKAKSNEGSGAFGKVTSIQRVDTVGGKAPPGGCEARTAGTKERVPYRATYYFYAGG